MQRTINMLVADDDRLIQELIIDAAQESQVPVRITATDNGRDCLTLLNGGNIDLAFIDIHMPELSGMEAFWVARRQGLATLVTLMSGEASPAVFELAQKLKAYEFLLKPFSVEGVIAIMRTCARISAPMKVLIVGDSSVHSVVRKVIQQSIFNCQITEAPDAARALLICREEPIDTVFLDCNMPHVDGLTGLRRMLAIRPALKVVMISDAHDAQKERQAREAGARGFLYKPFYAENVDRILHAMHGLRLPTLALNIDEPSMGELSRGAPITDAKMQIVA